MKAESLFYIEKYEQAEELFKNIEQNHFLFDEALPGRVMKKLKYQCYLKLGQINLFKEDLNQAEANLFRAKDENSDDYKVFKYLGELRSRQLNYQKASDFFEQSLDLNEDDEVKEELMICYFFLQKYPDALMLGNQLIQSAEENDIRNERVEKFLILTLITSGNIEDGLLLVNDFIKGNEASADYNALKGIIYREMGMENEAQEYFELTDELLKENSFNEEEIEKMFDQINVGRLGDSPSKLDENIDEQKSQDHEVVKPFQTYRTDNLSDISR